jgi:hypothetical protein
MEAKWMHGTTSEVAKIQDAYHILGFPWNIILVLGLLIQILGFPPGFIYWILILANVLRCPFQLQHSKLVSYLSILETISVQFHISIGENTPTVGSLNHPNFSFGLCFYS